MNVGIRKQETAGWGAVRGGGGHSASVTLGVLASSVIVIAVFSLTEWMKSFSVVSEIFISGHNF